MIREIQSKKVLNYHEDSFPTNWDVNPYRGCTIGCKYCFARYTHKYLGYGDFHKDILVKINAAECLEKELHSKMWKREQIKIGGTTDLYQHSEKKYELMPKIFDVIKRHKTPVFIQTKSNLILRDFDIIKELARITSVDIATSITTFDESVRRIVEPGACSTMERLEMLLEFKEICRSTTVGLMPIIPLLTDNDENLETAFRLTKEFGLNNIITSFLFLRGEVKPLFLAIIQKHFPAIYAEFTTIYSGSTVSQQYYHETSFRLNSFRRKYNLQSTFQRVEPPRNAIQLSIPFQE